MKKAVVVISLLFSQHVLALNLNGTTGYFGEIASVAPGFYSQVGVVLPTGVTCNGQPWLLLKRDHVLFKEIYAALLAAVAAGKNVHLGPLIGNVIDPSNNLCVISEAAIERVPGWSSQ